MRILIGIAITLFLGCLLLAWRLQSVSEESTIHEERAKLLAGELLTAQADARAVDANMAALSSSVDRLIKQSLQRDQELDKQLDLLTTLSKSEGESDEDFDCLRRPFPRSADEWLHNN